ncbi:hypothetical protein M422DRAFT_266656 [Sphaerobolus stellatus SS14]|uniref:DUF6533 domain-containing protein n=1 Tax=Sphaerobolus stellatus (strain SS14) TaxID=990650 RepID=A0A0C9TNM2_SPHS4|nr:hypothetical protein M422DRAFT_266656 [Sphaerobolus stellatus SS14]
MKPLDNHRSDDLDTSEMSDVLHSNPGIWSIWITPDELTLLLMCLLEMGGSNPGIWSVWITPDDLTSLLMCLSEMGDVLYSNPGIWSVWITPDDLTPVTDSLRSSSSIFYWSDLEMDKPTAFGYIREQEVWVEASLATLHYSFSMSTISITELTQELFYTRVASYVDMAALALIVYDTLLTLEDEITLIWRKKFGLGSILYILARYCAVSQMSTGWCLELLNSEGALSVKPFLASFDASLEDSVSVILICRFILQLRKFNTRVQTVPSVHIASTPGIRGRLQCIHETLIEEFGNSGIEYDLETENDMAELEGDTAPSGGIDTEVHITVEEFPWAINPMESAPGTLGSGNP